MSLPLVTVVIPTYNRAHLLERSLKSVLNQTYQNLDVIVVDDFSSDNTELLVNSLHDKRVRYIRHKQNMGAVAARNTGISAAKADYIAFQDSDDEWLPVKIEKQMRIFASAPQNLGVVFTSYWLIDNGQKIYSPPKNMVKQSEGDMHNALLEGNFVNAPTSVVRKACFDKAGNFENLPRLQEWGLWLRVSKYYHFKHIDEPLVNAYRQSDSISRNANAFIVARKMILKNYYGELSKRPKLLSQHYFEIGYALCINGQIKAGHAYFSKALKIQPFNIKLLLSSFTSNFGIENYAKLSSFYLQRRH